MIYSMTGFGRAEGVVNNRQVSVEIKALNGKQFDINTKIGPLLRSYELDIRNLISNLLMRGTIDLTIIVRQDGIARPMAVNTALARFYYESMHQIATELKISEEQMLSTIMRMPEVVTPDVDVISEKDWVGVKEMIKAACAQLKDFRKNEGESLHKDIKQRIENITNGLANIIPLEGGRIDRIKSRLQQAVAQMSNENIDANRFEQELIFYIERIDFSEEKTRLTQHCKYFLTILEKDEMLKGKQLNFVLQEIGREINTLGSKANDADIQQLIITMKDELEKAKEQVLNIL